MKSPLQKPETGQIKSKKGHSEPVSKGPEDFKAMGGGSTELHGSHRPFPPMGHNNPGLKEDPTISEGTTMNEVASELASKRSMRADAMDAAHMRGKKDITKAANE